jgi:hypothetical protein
LEVCTADDINQGQTQSHRPADVDLPEEIRGNLACIALMELEAAELEPGTADEVGEHRASRRGRQLQSQCLQDNINRLEPLIHVAAEQ